MFNFLKTVFMDKRNRDSEKQAVVKREEQICSVTNKADLSCETAMTEVQTAPTAQTPAQKRNTQSTEKRIQNVMSKTGWTREKTLEQLRDVKKRFGITFRDYDINNMHLIPEEKREEKCAEILARKECKKRENVIELMAVEARRAFVAHPKPGQNKTAGTTPGSVCKALMYRFEKGAEQNSPTDKQPEPIIATCYYLGIPMPAAATCACQPSAFVNFGKGDMNSIREVLGREVLPDTERSREEYSKFKEKYQNCNQLQHNDTDLAVYYTDWLMHCKDQGYDFDDYFDYEFFNKELAVRQKYISNGYGKYIKKLCNTDIRLFMNKGRFNAFFADEVHRDWLDVSKCNYDEFLKFIQKHDRFFAKPITGGDGGGVCVISSDMMEPEKLFAHCKDNGYIVEEIVRQNSEMSKFCADTVNTLRIYSLIDADGKAEIKGVVCRFGRMGNCADNFHCGGICALVDIDTGEVSGHAIDRAGNHCTVHPDTGVPLKGFVVPNWQQIKKATISAAEKCAHINRHVGWDVAITETGETEFIEGNSNPSFDILQAADKVGKMYIYKTCIDRLAKKLGAEPYEYPHMALDICGMES